MKKNIILPLLSIVFLTLFMLSCERDNYTDWKRLNEQWLEAHKNDAGFSTTESGLVYKIEHEGYQRRPNANSIVKIAYTGSYIDGTVFDESDSYTTYLSNFVPGFVEGLQLIKNGGSIKLYIPYQLGYGVEGGTSIPPYTVLIFDVTLIDSQY